VAVVIRPHSRVPPIPKAFRPLQRRHGGRNNERGRARRHDRRRARKRGNVPLPIADQTDALPPRFPVRFNIASLFVRYDAYKVSFRGHRHDRRRARKRGNALLRVEDQTDALPPCFPVASNMANALVRYDECLWRSKYLSGSG